MLPTKRMSIKIFSPSELGTAGSLKAPLGRVCINEVKKKNRKNTYAKIQKI
jgi:hypothetical protein